MNNEDFDVSKVTEEWNEETFKKWDEEWKKEHPIYNWIDTKLFPSGGLFGYAPHYSLTHPHVLIGDLLEQIKWAYQRVARGWDDRVVWSVDHWLDSIMPDILRKLNEIKHGTPTCLFEKLPEDVYEYTKEQEKRAHDLWDSIIKEMIIGFEASKQLDDLYIKTTFEDYKKEAKELERKRRKGMLLFVKHYNSLWD